MRKGLLTILFLIIFYPTIVSATPPYDPQFIGKTVVFLYKSGQDGKPDLSGPFGTGFLIRIPHLSDEDVTLLLVTARHIVDPEWVHCPATHNPTVIYARVNAASADSGEKVRYILVPLYSNDKPMWSKHTRDDVDAAVVPFPASDDDTRKSDFRALPVWRLPTNEELGMLSIGDDILSAGMLVNLKNTLRNYPVFKFGKISNIPEEDMETACGGPAREINAWLVAANLVPGNSGSPVFYYPPFGENGDITNPGLQRMVLVGVQSSSAMASDVAFVTPANYVFDIIKDMNLKDADLYRGKMPKPQ